MSLCPSTVSSAGLLPADFYFALKSDIAPPQVLSQNANTVSLSGGGGAVNIASTSAVALSTQKLTAVTYDTGLLETNVAGVLNVGLGSAIGSTRVEGAKIVIERTLADPQIEFVKGVNVERIKYDGTKLLMGSVGISGEIYDNLGNPGAAGQQLQSSGPGLPFVWGAGSGVGLTAVVAGTNISVDNTNPIAPVVAVAISSTLDMSGEDISNCANVAAETMVLTSDLGKVTFNNGLGVLKGSIGYNVGTDFTKLTGVAGVEINTTAGPINIEANGDKINLTTNGNNIELFGNTTGGFFADVNIGTADGDLDMAIGGNITMNAGTTGGDITITAFADFSVSSTTVKLPTLPPASTANQLFYDTSTKEVSYGPAFPAIAVQAATGTIALTEAMNRATYILTGTSATQSFSQAGLVGVAAGWTVYLRNGNNATGLTQDITISIPAGNTTLHAPTGVTNSSYILLYWTGSVLVAYR